MPYTHIVDVAAPAEMYDAMHQEIIRRAGGDVPGLLVHLGRATGEGFQVLEVWRSEEDFHRFNDAVVLPAMRDLAAAHPGPAPEQTITRSDVLGLVLAGDVLV